VLARPRQPNDVAAPTLDTGTDRHSLQRRRDGIFPFNPNRTSGQLRGGLIGGLIDVIRCEHQPQLATSTA